jgi:dehydrogenase/reductase SDR family protein 12
MDATSLIDTILDRSVVLGYGSTGFEVRRRLSGWPADPPRMDGRVVLVTGAASGIGLAAAAGFARLGASVWALARDDERAGQAARLIRSRVGTAARAFDVRPVACDLSSLAALHAFTGWFGRQEQRLDVLVNNAGVMPGQRTRTVDGVELTFATHVLAPWVLIEGLTPLRVAASSRVINVTSGGQYGQKIPGGDIESDRARYGPKRILRPDEARGAGADRAMGPASGRDRRTRARDASRLGRHSRGAQLDAGVPGARPARHPDSRARRGHHRLARRRPGGCRDGRAVLA